MVRAFLAFDIITAVAGSVGWALLTLVEVRLRESIRAFIASDITTAAVAGGVGWALFTDLEAILFKSVRAFITSDIIPAVALSVGWAFVATLLINAVTRRVVMVFTDVHVFLAFESPAVADSAVWTRPAKPAFNQGNLIRLVIAFESPVIAGGAGWACSTSWRPVQVSIVIVPVRAALAVCTFVCIIA